jgi:hypothetical protein
MSREQAINCILYALRSPLILLSAPQRKEAEVLAAEHEITALDLLEYAINLARARTTIES